MPGLRCGLPQNAFCHKYFRLLLIEGIDGKKPFFLDGVKTFKTHMRVRICFNVAEIAVYVAELVPQLFPDFLDGFPVAFIKLEGPASCYFTVCAWQIYLTTQSNDRG